MKIFGWKISRNLLPTRSNLRSRGMEMDVSCPICHQATETMLHCFKDCKAARRFWSRGAKELGVEDADGLIGLRDALLDGRVEVASSLLFGLWSVWLNRNSVMTGGRPKDTQVMVDSTLVMKEEWIRKQASSCKGANKIRGVWKRPSQSMFKLNFDGSLFKDHGSAGVGAIIRDDHGRVMAAIASKEQALADPAHTQALAAYRAVSFALEAGFSEFTIEGDSLGLIKALASKAPVLSPIGHIVEATKAMLSKVKNLSIHHVKRDGNKAAHGLAIFAHSVDDQCVWLEEVPPCIFHVVGADVQISGSAFSALRQPAL